MKWVVQDGRKAALLKDDRGNAKGALVQCKGFCLGFVHDSASPIRVSAEKFPARLLGAYPSVNTACRKVENEVSFFDRYGNYPNILKR